MLIPKNGTRRRQYWRMARSMVPSPPTTTISSGSSCCAPPVSSVHCAGFGVLLVGNDQVALRGQAGIVVCRGEATPWYSRWRRM